MIKRLTGIHVQYNVKIAQRSNCISSHGDVVDDVLIVVAASVHAILPEMLLGSLPGSIF
jgi:hypothetical protein